jgi:nucleoside-diphosphate-sugar epimerase
MQTILGAGGAIGIPLAKELPAYTNKVRLVARNPKKINKTDELFAGDLTDKDFVNKAVAGSDVVYLTVGLPYNIKVWKHQWPIIMANTIDSCILHHSKLVFVDNIYAYAKNEVAHMTEESRIAPETKKGKVRAQLIHMIEDAIKNKNLTAIIARSADFYGTDAKTSLLQISVFDKFKKGQKAFWQSDASKIHSFTYTPDAAKAIAILGNSAGAGNQTWHLPTSPERWTGSDFIKCVAEEMNVKPKYFILNKIMIRLTGIFSPVVKELYEMQYQNDQDYFFDSSKFEKQFSFTPTNYDKGIKEILRSENTANGK